MGDQPAEFPGTGAFVHRLFFMCALLSTAVGCGGPQAATAVPVEVVPDPSSGLRVHLPIPDSANNGRVEHHNGASFGVVDRPSAAVRLVELPTHVAELPCVEPSPGLGDWGAWIDFAGTPPAALALELEPALWMFDPGRECLVRTGLSSQGRAVEPVAELELDVRAQEGTHVIPEVLPLSFEVGGAHSVRISLGENGLDLMAAGGVAGEASQAGVSVRLDPDQDLSEGREFYLARQRGNLSRAVHLTIWWSVDDQIGYRLRATHFLGDPGGSVLHELDQLGEWRPGAHTIWHRAQSEERETWSLEYDAIDARDELWYRFPTAAGALVLEAERWDSNQAYDCGGDRSVPCCMRSAQIREQRGRWWFQPIGVDNPIVLVDFDPVRDEQIEQPECFE